MNIKDAIGEAAEKLSREGIGSSKMAAESLMMFALGCDRAYLYAHPEWGLSAEEERQFAAVVRERLTGKPLQYITGRQEFWGLEFVVSPAVLIPRPETEHLVESALEIVRAERLARPRIIDVGTGSGCVIVALASELRDAELQATDISAAALEVARENAKRLGFGERVRFHECDLLAGVDGEFDVVVSNPPYVGLCERDKVQREVREHEPETAVFAGEQGLDIYRRLIPQAWERLKPGGWLLMEIGFSIEQQVRELLVNWSDVRTVADLQGIARVVVAKVVSS
ncbi:MAG: [protein release factor]-glutamine N5-methyltransferase [Acidobacteriales bacterium]|nr:[protein release factor]-glutamine N5-methyltransferase [Terriglobales bacterium]